MKRNLIMSFILLMVGLSSVSAQADSISVAEYFDRIKDKEVLLQQFFSNMPKGGDLHNHLTGSVYAETYFTLATKDRLYVDMKTGRLSATQKSGYIQLSPDMKDLHQTRMTLIDLWSIRNYEPYKSSIGPDEYFFGTFGLFSAVTKNHQVELLQELKERASKENVQYLEIMLTSPRVDTSIIASKYSEQNKNLAKTIVEGTKIELEILLANIFIQWKKNSGMNKLVKEHVNLVDSLDSHSQIPRGMDAPVCYYQSYASRNSDPLTVYAQLYIAFNASLEKGSKIVGVNIVSAEDGEKSLLYYDGHMGMFEYLKKVFPAVKTSMHAGELALGLVKPENLQNHIHKAVLIANADRIGHGVDIAFERGSVSLLNEMRRRKVCVEINLVSNEFILGVLNDEHPYALYARAGVPMVISTDDPGILRTNLVEQYVLLVLRYGVDYKTVKTLIRNSIHYSFAPSNRKAALLNELNQQLKAFEANWAQTVKVDMSTWAPL